MTKHLIKALEQELETTRIALRKQVTIMKKIEDWLEDEVNESNKYTFDDYNDFDDTEVYLFRGRHECAESLLKQIEKWEEIND